MSGKYGTAAGADTADVLISLAPLDEINLPACSMAKSIGTRYTIAQVERAGTIPSDPPC